MRKAQCKPQILYQWRKKPGDFEVLVTLRYIICEPYETFQFSIYKHLCACILAGTLWGWNREHISACLHQFGLPETRHISVQRDTVTFYDVRKQPRSAQRDTGIAGCWKLLSIPPLDPREPQLAACLRWSCTDLGIASWHFVSSVTLGQIWYEHVHALGSWTAADNAQWMADVSAITDEIPTIFAPHMWDWR